MTRNGTGVTLGVACLLALSACSGGGDGDEAGNQAAQEALSESTVGRISPPDLVKPPSVKDGQGAVRDLALGTCDVEPGKQSVTGVISSSAAKTVDYLVVVDWTTERADVMGRGYVVLDGVEPGEKREFTLEADVAEGAENCAPFVQYGEVEQKAGQG